MGLSGERMTAPEWFDNYEDHFGLKGDETGEDEARFMVRALRLGRGRRVLDAPCGAGRIAVHLARAGCNVTGIDITACYLARARRRFRSEGLKGAFLRRDMRKLDCDAEFDAVLNWQGSFGYFSDAENLDVLRRFARAVRPGGRVLIDQPNREFILRHFRASGRRGDVRIVTRWDAHTQRAVSTWTRASGRGRRRWRMSIRLYTPAEFRRLFAQAGLRVEAIYGGLDGCEYHRGSRRIHIVGRPADRRTTHER